MNYKNRTDEGNIMGFLDNLEAYMDHHERANHTCAFEKDADGKVTCSKCGAAKDDGVK
jgi:hypothetical protein